jgi:hypothetical protein
LIWVVMTGSNTARQSEYRNNLLCTMSFTVIIFCFVRRFGGSLLISSVNKPL